MIQISSRVVYRNHWMSLREDGTRLPDGSSGLYSVVDKPTAALVIPADGDGVHLIEQYRYPIGRRSWEFPQGTWSDGREAPGEELARAELAEETGLRAQVVRRIGRIAIAPGLTSQWCDVFVATGLTRGPHARERTEQGMDQRWAPRRQVTEMIRSGEIIDSPTIAAYAMLGLDGT